jgi:hypothetical protein
MHLPTATIRTHARYLATKAGRSAHALDLPCDDGSTPSRRARTARRHVISAAPADPRGAR